MDNATEARSGQRPMMVSVISFYYFLTAGYSLTQLTLLRSGMVAVHHAQKSYFGSLSADLLVAFMECLILSAALALFCFRRVAFHLFCASLALSMSISLWRALTRNWISVEGIESLVGFGGAWTMMLFVCIYTRRLGAKGILK